MGRTCSTPGCTLRDFHIGAHSFEHSSRSRKCHPSRRRIAKRPAFAPFKIKSPRGKSIHSPTERTFQGNDFQLDLRACRRAMEAQVGVRIVIPRTAFCDRWPDAPEMCTGRILGPSHVGRFVAEALFDNESEPTRLTSSSLMLCDAKAEWRVESGKDPSALHEAKRGENLKHDHAYVRAKEMMSEFIRHCRDHHVDTNGRFVLTLDGMGTNHTAFQEAIREEELASPPAILTAEMKADVALAQRVALALGGDVLFTGGDPLLSVKDMFAGRGVPTVEHLLLKENRILTEGVKERTLLLNLDYCGGPPMNHDPKSATFLERAVAHLPNLEMVAFTVARRNHSSLDATFDDLVPPPYGFLLWRTYLTNPRVVCKVYVRDRSVPRILSIPGCWWEGGGHHKRRTFIGVLLGGGEGNLKRVYVPVDDEEYAIREDAVKAYAR